MKPKAPLKYVLSEAHSHNQSQSTVILRNKVISEMSAFRLIITFDSETVVEICGL